MPFAPSRRALLRSGAAGAAALATRPRLGHPAGADAGDVLFPLKSFVKAPVKVSAFDLLRVGPDHVVRVRDEEGAVGYAVTNQHAPYLGPMFHQRIVPAFLGKDARDLEALVDEAYLYGRNYKLAGVPLWCCLSWAEFAVLDLLGRKVAQPVWRLLGGDGKRRRVPIYVSSTDRESTPEEEVQRFEGALATTGARALKYKVGGRMSGNADASQGRTEALVRLVRKRFGDEITCYADANGSYDVKTGIEVGRMLEAHGVSIFEEPCPFEDYESTRQVTRALKRVMVAGGEQDHSYFRFEDIVKKRVLDMVQPDLSYNGGFVRSTRVARLAARARMPISPHCPQASTLIYTLHFAALTPNLGPFQEYHVALVGKPPWYAPSLQPQAGELEVPSRPGFGWQIDEGDLRKAEAV